MHRRCCVFLLIQEDIPLPARVSGINGQFAAALYRDSVRSGNFAANCEQLTTFANALTEIDPFVRRVFESTSYAPEDCWEGLALLIGEGKLGDFDSLSDIAREVIIADKENMPKFEAARKAAAKHEAWGQTFYYHEYREGGHSVGSDHEEDAKRAAEAPVRAGSHTTWRNHPLPRKHPARGQRRVSPVWRDRHVDRRRMGHPTLGTMPSLHRAHRDHLGTLTAALRLEQPPE